MIKKFFNWAAGKPSCQYTLGGGGLSFKFNRLGRLAERVLFAKPLLVGGVFALMSVPMALTCAPTAVAAATAGALVLAFGKAASLIGGGVMHLAAAGTNGVVNHIAAKRAPRAS